MNKETEQCLETIKKICENSKCNRCIFKSNEIGTCGIDLNLFDSCLPMDWDIETLANQFYKITE